MQCLLVHPASSTKQRCRPPLGEDRPTYIGALLGCVLTGAHTLALQVVCTLGPCSRAVEVIEELLRAGMNVARFNFSHGSHEYHQVCAQEAALRRWLLHTRKHCSHPWQQQRASEAACAYSHHWQQSRLQGLLLYVLLPACIAQETLDNLKKAMENTKIMCAVMLDTKVRADARASHAACAHQAVVDDRPYYTSRVCVVQVLSAL